MFNNILSHFVSIITPALGGIVGFILAQFVNIAKIVVLWWRRPRFAFDYVQPDMMILSDSEETEHGPVGRNKYGFTIQNRGRTPAYESQVFLTGAFSSADGKHFRPVINYAQCLPWVDADEGKKYSPAIILPGTGLLVSLGEWSEMYDGIYFSTRSTPDYYEEAMNGARYLRVSVAVTAKNADHKNLTYTMTLPR